MLDLHCHILPAVDDGPETLEEALDLARFSVADGITHITATPHCHRHIHMLRADILPHVERFNAHLAAHRIALSVLPGSEIQINDTGDFQREFEAGLFCHPGDRCDFLLVEFNWKPDLYPADAPGLIRWIRDEGTIPLVAHPERHGFFQEDAPRLRAVVEAGAWLQVTVDSLLGNNGKRPRFHGEAILRTYPDCVLATDAHNMRRCSGLSAGYAAVGERLSGKRAEDLRARAERVLATLLASATPRRQAAG